MKLSPRLNFIFQHLLPGQDVWDTCCDHGMIGARALHDGRFPQVHFVDQVPHIISKLRLRVLAQVESRNLPVQPFFYPIPVQQIVNELQGTLVVAGVGGLTLIEILETCRLSPRFTVKRLILGAQDHAEDLRSYLNDKWLGDHGDWQIAETGLIQEGRRQREILVLDCKQQS